MTKVFSIKNSGGYFCIRESKFTVFCSNTPSVKAVISDVLLIPLSLSSISKFFEEFIPLKPIGFQGVAQISNNGINYCLERKTGIRLLCKKQKSYQIFLINLGRLFHSSLMCVLGEVKYPGLVVKGNGVVIKPT